VDVNKLKTQLQSYFGDGLVTIVGTGLSIAEGVPGMPDLQRHLQERMPKTANPAMTSDWSKIASLLTSGKGLEAALTDAPPRAELESAIVDLTSDFVLAAEMSVIQEVLAGTRILRFTRLLKHMLKPNNGIPVITTNYDRLLEIGAERTGLGIDTMFCGQHISHFDPKGSKLSLCRGVALAKGSKSVRLTYKKFVKLFKPHGSLDWYLLNDTPVRCQYNVNLQRLIITPGLNKYMTGYASPFDTHRERANHEVDRASRFLIIGYGFNDSHLETHLHKQLKIGKPALILTHSLTERANEIVRECGNVTAICADDERTGSKVIQNGQTDIISGCNIWDVNDFIDEVLEP